MEVQGVTTVHTGISAGLIQAGRLCVPEPGKVLERRSHPPDGRRNRKQGGTVMSVQWTEDQKKVIELRNRNILVSAAAVPEKRRFW